VSASFGGCGKKNGIFVYRVPCYLLRNAQKRDKNKSSKTTELEEKKSEGKFILCDEPRLILLSIALALIRQPLATCHVRHSVVTAGCKVQRGAGSGGAAYAYT
jgi:hypothetical protein